MSRKLQVLIAITIPLITFSVLTSGFLIYDTMTGNKSLASTLRVIGFCPAGQENLVGASGLKGETGATGATGPVGAQGEAGACQAPMNLAAIAASMIPTKDNTFSLGTKDFRWKDIQIGPGTIYIQDQKTGKQAAMSVIDGVVKLDGANQLEIGSLRFVDNNIESVFPAEDIKFGMLDSIANVIFQRNVKMAAGKTITFGDGSVFSTAPTNGLNGSQGATGPAGNDGAAGPQGIQGVQGASGNSFTIKGHYATYELFTAGAGAGAGARGDAYFIDSNGALMVYGESAWFDSGRLIGPQGIQGLQGPKGDTGATGPAGAPATLDPWGKQFVCVVTTQKKNAMYWGTCSSQGLTGTEYWILATFPR